MTKHRRITGFAAIAMIAVAATAVSVKSHSPWIDGNKHFMADLNRIQGANFDDRWSAMTTQSEPSR
jgi:hypothetical protein